MSVCEAGARQAPRAAESQIMRANESVSRRAVVAGMMSVAAMSVTPTTLMEATMVAARASANRASIQPLRMPKMGATSGSKVMNSSRL